MNTLYTIATLTLACTMACSLARLLLGKGVYNRVLAFNVFGSQTILLLVILSFLIRRPEFLDISLLYALLNFMTSIAILRFSRSAASKQKMENQK